MHCRCQVIVEYKNREEKRREGKKRKEKVSRLIYRGFTGVLNENTGLDPWAQVGVSYRLYY
jgi:hypothetical protein